MRCAAIDIGTNSCRLLIAAREGQRLETLYKEIETTRIGAGLSQSGQISGEAAQRSWQWLEKIEPILRAYDVQYARAVATSAVREAGNGQAFVEEAVRRSHMSVEIISGEEEAKLSYIGVEKGLQLDHPPLVADLGGGSTEFICNHQDFVISLPVGAVRATEMQMNAADIAERLQPVQAMQGRFAEYPLVMVGGTASTIASVKLGLDEYDSKKVHGHQVTRQEAADIYQLLERTPLPLRKRLPGLQPERADIINAGVLITMLIMELLGKSSILVSDSDLLQGIIWSQEYL
ncbi:MAG TPA: Ppx/GppA family phosphatase [Syntrophomonas sp.]|nr:Ppx/GppA family phosphatase [Syntrophomonas sp.]HRW13368.1 Ppx/GppA family phosphatase [Syntrophomonas sp.]